MRIAAQFTCLAICAGTAAADTITVAVDGSGDHASIQSAIDAVPAGFTVNVEAGTYTGTGENVIELPGHGISIIGVDGAEEQAVIRYASPSGEVMLAVINLIVTVVYLKTGAVTVVVVLR